MNTVGFMFTLNITPVCQPYEMLQFFKIIKRLIETKKARFEILSQRLYKKYLTFEQLNKALEEIILIKNLTNKDNFERYICDSLTNAITASQYFKKSLNSYTPVRIVISEITSFEDQFRDLSEYDNLQGPPFWLREYLQEYPDTVLPFE